MQAVVDQLRARAAGVDIGPPPTLVSVLAAEVSTVTTLREATDRLELLQTGAAQLMEARTVEDIAAVVVDNASSALGILSGRVFLVDGDVLWSVGVQGGAQEWIQRYDQVPLDADLPGSVAFSDPGAGRAAQPRSDRERFPALAAVYDTERTLHIAPLAIGDHVLGVLSLSFPATGRLAEDAQARFVQALGDAAAQAM